MATTSYTYDLKCNGNNVSQVKINGTDVKRVKVNGNDVIHKFNAYSTTLIIRIDIIFDTIKNELDYVECGDDYYKISGSGRIAARYYYTGDSMNLSGASVPPVTVVFNDFVILSDRKVIDGTYKVTPTESGATILNFDKEATGFYWEEFEDKRSFKFFSNYQNSYMLIDGTKYPFTFSRSFSMSRNEVLSGEKDYFAYQEFNFQKTVQEY